jgi:RNA polymerase sporulation-specific sigma factor
MAKSKLAIPIDDNLETKTDEQLIAYAKSGEQDALDCIFKKYKELVNMKVSKYFIIGAEKEDIVQEGLIGLYKAIKNFDIEKQNSFKSFANLCIERQLITAIKTSNRQKHIPLNSSLSLNTSAYDGDEDSNSLMEMLNSETVEDPLDTLTKKEYYKTIGTKIDETLSIFEKQVLSRYVMGDSYVTIAEKLDSPVKSIDNAIQRIRKKAVKSIMDEE